MSTPTAFVRVLIMCATFASFSHAQTEPGVSVLYVTQEQGRWHDYPKQLEAFTALAEGAGWNLTVRNPPREEMVEWLATPNFAEGFDVVVYNFCLGNDRSNLDSMVNIAAQTRNGVPSLFIHGCAHSFWDTFKPKGGKDVQSLRDLRGEPFPEKASANRELVAQWNEQHPGEPFPTWVDFLGVGSIRHGKPKPIDVERLCDHPVTTNTPERWRIEANAELYNNFMVLDTVIPLCRGHQEDEDPAVVAWIHPQGKSKVLGITLGHGMKEWQHAYVQQLIVDGVNYLAAHPENNEVDAQAKAAVEAAPATPVE